MKSSSVWLLSVVCVLFIFLLFGFGQFGCGDDDDSSKNSEQDDDDSDDDNDVDDDDDSVEVHDNAPEPSNENGIFVAKNGKNSNPGTMESPKQTIGNALETAALEDKVVFVSQGIYEESIVASRPVSIQ